MSLPAAGVPFPAANDCLASVISHESCSFIDSWIASKTVKVACGQVSVQVHHHAKFLSQDHRQLQVRVTI